MDRAIPKCPLGQGHDNFDEQSQQCHCVSCSSQDGRQKQYVFDLSIQLCVCAYMCASIFLLAGRIL